MLEDIKKAQGINHDEFDDTIKNLIAAAKKDLKAVGIADSFLDKEVDPLVRQAINTYALSNLDVDNSEMYANSYLSQKDALRHYNEYHSNPEISEVEDGVHWNYLSNA